MSVTLSSPVETLPLFETRLRNSLLTAGFLTAGDLLAHYPFRWEDRRSFDGWPHSGEAPDAGDGTVQPVCLHGAVTDVQVKRTGPRGSFLEVKLEPPELHGLSGFSQPVVLRWFNMPFLQKSFAAEQEVIVFGKPKHTKNGRIFMDHPEYEILNDDPAEAIIHLQRIAPVYRAQSGVNAKSLRRAVFRILENLDDATVPDILPPPSEAGEFSGLSRAKALRMLHFPDTFPDLEKARRYLALEEFFVLQLNVLHRRAQWESLAGEAHCGPGKLLAAWRETLPFSLTGAQERTIAEIREDLTRTIPMNRLLQGDVGSGKTFVALAAMLLAVESGCQAALMAPTQILAEQHYLNFRRWLEPLNIRIGLRTASRKENAASTSDLPLFSSNEDASGNGKSGEHPQILIGTHALLHGDSELPDLGLAVIDEQHKFGVEQRTRLVRQGRAPHVLVMTATPIPRTLTMTVYGDLEVSVLDEMPAGRRPVITAVRENPDPAQVAAFLQEQFTAGRQAYLVYPLIGESETLDLKAATKEFAAWEQHLSPWKTGLLHGRLSPQEKEDVMRRFRANEVQALVSTSVIEVGVDVPNASVMIIFEAERFGLAQLHQLRGRIGRGAHKSWCILVAGGGGKDKSAEGLERLHILAQTSDGFAVAEADLQQRGPGDLLGTAQSGLPGLNLGDLVRDTKLVKTARRLARETLAADPDFSQPRHQLLRGLLLQTRTADGRA